MPERRTVIKTRIETGREPKKRGRICDLASQQLTDGGPISLFRKLLIGLGLQRRCVSPVRAGAKKVIEGGLSLIVVR